MLRRALRAQAGKNSMGRARPMESVVKIADRTKMIMSLRTESLRSNKKWHDYSFA